MPSTSSTSPATTYVILVTVDTAQQTLNITVPFQELTSGDLVVWSFVDLPEGWTPALRFDDDHRQGLGPFAVLRQTQSEVWGQGSDGSEQERTYQAVLLPPEGNGSDPWQSQSAKILIRGEANSSPVVIVTPNLSNGTFEVNLENVTRLGGDSVVFQFEGLTADQVPSLHFHTETLQGSATPQASPHLGPFNAFCRDVNAIAAEGANGRIGKFEYNVVVTEMLDGQWQEKKLRRSPDPFVYSEEDPVDPSAAT